MLKLLMLVLAQTDCSMLFSYVSDYNSHILFYYFFIQLLQINVEKINIQCLLAKFHSIWLIQ